MRCCARSSRGGKVDAALLEQRAARRPTASPGSRSMSRRCARCRAGRVRLRAAGRFGEREELIHRLAFAEYLARIAGGIPMNQVEIVRAARFRPAPRARSSSSWPSPCARLIEGATPSARLRLAELIHDGDFGDCRPVRRQPGDDPRPVPQVRRGGGQAVRAWLARARRADPAGGDRASGRARRVRPHHPRGVRRARASPRRRCASSPRS